METFNDIKELKDISRDMVEHQIFFYPWREVGPTKRDEDESAITVVSKSGIRKIIEGGLH